MMIGTDTICEPQRSLPVVAEYDVVVVGGGIAGTAAAVAAARTGSRVCLLEKESAVGGLATLGNVIVWLPICDGMGRQVIGGLGEEMLRLSVAELGDDDRLARFARVPACWEADGDLAERRKTRFRVAFNPSSYLLSLEKWLVEAGVDIWYDTRLCAVHRRDDRITHALVENKSGRLAVAGKSFVDATGDADLAWLAGEATESLNSNVLCGWFYYLVNGRLHLKPYTNPYSSKMVCEGATGPFFRGDDGRQVTRMILGSRDLMREQLQRLREQHSGDEVQIFAPPTIACFRATRRLIGGFSLSRADDHRWFDDAVGLTGDWRQCGPVFSIPWRCIAGLANRNLAVAGRCISVDSSIWDCTRAIPACAVTGQAAGTATALAAGQGDGGLTELPIIRLQQQLVANDVILDRGLLG